MEVISLILHQELQQVICNLKFWCNLEVLFLYNISEHENFEPLHLLYYEEAHFGHGGHYQSIRPANEPSLEVEQPGSEPIAETNYQVIILNAYNF